MTPCFAIIDANNLSCIALRNILYDMFSQVEVHTYNDIDSYIRDSNRHFVHFFVSSEMLFAHSDEFETLKHMTTVLSAGRNINISVAGFRILDISLPEQDIVNNILMNVQSYGHGNVMADQKMNAGSRLSPREKDVLALMVKGFINKENVKLKVGQADGGGLGNKGRTRSKLRTKGNIRKI